MRRRTIFKLAAFSAAIATYGHKIYNQNSSVDKLAVKAGGFRRNTKNVNISLNWTKVVAKSTPLIFGSNDFQVVDVENATNPQYRDILEDIGFGLIRIHHAKISDRWTNPKTKTWDVEKITQIYQSYCSSKAILVQNIPKWPSWMAVDENGLLKPEEYQNYGNFCAELVKIINGQLNHQVMYWEPLNEQDVPYYKAGKLEQLWQIYNLVTKAMKAQDPRIKVGGPVLTWDSSGKLAAFLEACSSNVDFISWHRYSSGNANDSTYKLMSYTPKYAEQVRQFRQVTKKYIPHRHVPLLLGEYNINYSWRSGEKRQKNHIGAVWFASTLKHLAESGIDMAASWNLKDGIYGLIDPKNQLRYGGEVFRWAIKYLIGEVVMTYSNDSLVEAMAVKQGNHQRSLLLINKSAKSANVIIDDLGCINDIHVLPIFYLDKNGIKKTTITPYSLLKSPFSLPGYSLALAVF